MSEPNGLLVNGCTNCHSRYLPRPGRCPRCGSDRVSPLRIPARATVLAATELSVAPAGFATPHRLALLEASDGVRILAVARGPLPALGSVVNVMRDADVYLVVDEGTPVASPKPP
ncbi:MAG: hypothetical protein L3K07_01980 [Thermoplasmata archaeon]|nr:hypothetical protein [Thermoplasmata archaeon]